MISNRSMNTLRVEPDSCRKAKYLSVAQGRSKFHLSLSNEAVLFCYVMYFPPVVRPRKGIRDVQQENKEKGVKPPENKSFLQKYWMYLLPIAILLLMGKGGEGQEGGGGGGGGGSS